MATARGGLVQLVYTRYPFLKYSVYPPNSGRIYEVFFPGLFRVIFHRPSIGVTISENFLLRSSTLKIYDENPQEVFFLYLPSISRFSSCNSCFTWRLALGINSLFSHL